MAEDIRAVAKNIPVSAQKTRLVVDMVRGKKVDDALGILQFTQKRGAKVVSKLLNSAVANAENKGDIDIDTLYIQKIFVDQGPTLKRFKPRAMGRATMIQKKTSHISIILDEA